MLAPLRCWARLERWHKSWCALHVGEWEGSAYWAKWHRAGAWGRRLWQEKQPAAGYRKMWDTADSLYLMSYFLTASCSSCCSFPCCPVLVPTASISPWWRGVLQATVVFHFVGNAIVEVLSHLKSMTPLYPVSHPTCAICLWRSELEAYFRTRWSGLKLHQGRFSLGY